MKQAYADSIAHLKSLYKGEYLPDPGHDLSHSERVVALARDIAEHENYEDLDLVELIAWWHDAARATGVSTGHEHVGAEMARDDLLGRGVDSETAETVFDAIYYHGHDPAEPTKNIEGKILKDADKIEVHTKARLERCAAAGWPEQAKADARRWFEVIPQYSDRNFYAFEYSCENAKKHIAQFETYYDSAKSQILTD